MVTLFFRQFARYPFLYVLGAFPAWLKVLSCNFGAILLKKPKNVRDSAPLSLNLIFFLIILLYLTILFRCPQLELSRICVHDPWINVLTHVLDY